jgi:hypothetical protein
MQATCWLLPLIADMGWICRDSPPWRPGVGPLPPQYRGLSAAPTLCLGVPQAWPQHQVPLLCLQKGFRLRLTRRRCRKLRLHGRHACVAAR